MEQLTEEETALTMARPSLRVCMGKHCGNLRLVAEHGFDRVEVCGL